MYFDEHTLSPEHGSFTLRLFGPMEVQAGGQSLPRLRSRKGKWLLAILALQSGRDVDREWLADTLWPEDHVTAAKRSLRQSVFDLRAAMGTEAWRISSESRDSLRLRLENAWVDALAFDALVARGDAASLESAVRLYRGPLLEDCAVEWALEARAARENSYLKTLQMLASAASTGGNPGSAAGYLRRAAEAQPFDENAQRALMEALCDAGDDPEAVIVYRKFRDLLWREMSIAPSEGTTALYRKILRGRRETAKPSGTSRALDAANVRTRSHAAPPAGPAPARAAPRTRPLPIPLTDLIGREEEVKEVRDRLARFRLVTLTGIGGIGKTRLALRVAADLECDLENGAVFVDLAAITDASLAPDSVRQALGLPESVDGRDVQETLSDYLASREVLLVLDNCEHLTAGCASLADRLLSRCPALRILATSRQALGLRGEAVYCMPSLGLPPGDTAAPRHFPRVRIADAMTFPAIQLFVERARAASALFDLTPRNMETVAAACRRLDGIPLAIELAAARVRSLSLSELNFLLKKDFSVLQGTPSWGVERHQTLQRVYDWSWNLLTPPEQSTMAALSVFAGGWTLDAAQTVCADDRERGTENGGRRTKDGVRGTEESIHPPIYPEEVVDLLTSLVDKSLVVYLPPSEEGELRSDDMGLRDSDAELNASSAGRYRLLETVRQFAEQKLTDSGRREAVMRRHFDFYLIWAEAHSQKLWGPGAAFWFEQFEVEHDNLRAAIAWRRARGEIHEEFRLLFVMSRFWDTHGHLREGRVHLEAALARVTSEVPAPIVAGLSVRAGWSALEQTDCAAARKHFQQALGLYRSLEDLSCAADVLNFLASTAMLEEKLDEARTRFEESLLLQRESGGPIAAVLNNMAELDIMEGDLRAAEERLTEAASLCRKSGHSQLLGIVYWGLSVVAYCWGRPRDAKDHCAASIRYLRDMGALVKLPAGLLLMGIVCVELGAPERAARLLGAATALGEVLGTPLKTRIPAIDQAIDRAAATGRYALGAPEFEALYNYGQMLSLEQAIEYALSED